MSGSQNSSRPASPKPTGAARIGKWFKGLKCPCKCFCKSGQCGCCEFVKKHKLAFIVSLGLFVAYMFSAYAINKPVQQKDGEQVVSGNNAEQVVDENKGEQVVDENKGEQGEDENKEEKTVEVPIVEQNDGKTEEVPAEKVDPVDPEGKKGEEKPVVEGDNQ